MAADALAERIRALPDRPGIYIFRDAAGKVLYVGKATSLRKRAASYLVREHEPRLAAMLAEAADVEFVATDTTAEALLLENTWIKRRKPRYNILLRDDKTYPYLKLTADHYPRLAFTRRMRDDGAEYFGPFLPGGLARKAIKLVQKLFQVRVCDLEIDGSLPRPCLYYDMHRCLGPCVAGLTTKAAYDEAVEQARLFLSGRGDQLVKRLKREMWEAAEALDYERAARVRDALTEVEAITQRRKLSSVEGEDVDVYGVYVAGGNAAVVVLVMRGGQVLDRRELFWEGVGPIAPERLLSEILPQIYDRTTFVPKEIHLPLPVEGEEALAEWLAEKKGEQVYVRLPSRGPKAERVALAMRNAELAHKRRFRGGDTAAPGAAALLRHLDLPEPPRRIEGFDISNFQGSETVASLVVWEEGKMRKGEYRSFNMRGVPGTPARRLRLDARGGRAALPPAPGGGRGDARPDPDRRRPRPAQRRARGAGDAGRGGDADRLARQARGGGLRAGAAAAAQAPPRRPRPAPAPGGARRGPPLRGLAPPPAAERAHAAQPARRALRHRAAAAEAAAHPLRQRRRRAAGERRRAAGGARPAHRAQSLRAAPRGVSRTG